MFHTGAMVQIKSPEDLEKWLKDKPPEVAAALASRIALRVLPQVLAYDLLGHGFVKQAILAHLRAGIVSISSLKAPRDDFFAQRIEIALIDTRADAIIAFSALMKFSVNSYSPEVSSIASAAASAVYSSIFATESTSSAIKRDKKGSIDGAYGATNAAIANLPTWLIDSFLLAISNDIEFIVESTSRTKINVSLPLWANLFVPHFVDAWRSFRDDKRNYSSWSNWIDWYQRRLDGSASEWGLSPDGDAEMARRLIEVDEDFWKRGEEDPSWVNAEIGKWLDELREPVVQMVSQPAQSPGAIQYTTDDAGRVTRAPVAQQGHLKNVPAQRSKYRAIREKVEDLREEPAQRLGAKPKRCLDRLHGALPEAFEAAIAPEVWIAFRALNAIWEKHLLAEQLDEPDDHRLETSIAADTRELVALINNFAFGDDALRAEDEKTIAPQTRAALDTEVRAAQPLLAELKRHPELADAIAANDLEQGSEVIDAAGHGPFDDQLVDQVSTQRRNWIAALITGAWDRANALRKKSVALRKSAMRGAAFAVGNKAMAFLIEHKDKVIAFVQKAFPTVDIAAIIQRIADALKWL